MLDEIFLINRIKSETGYTDVQYAVDSVSDLHKVALTQPKIYVGHLGIKLRYPQNLDANGLVEIENPELLITAIQILCRREDLSEVRQKVKDAYVGYSPYPQDSDYSSITFLEATVVAKTNEKIWWQEVIGLEIPRVS